MGPVERARRKLGGMVATGFFTGVSRAASLTPWADPGRHGVEVISDIPYLSTGSPFHNLDVYRPVEVDRPLSVMLYIHGGGFRILSKESHWVFALAFARKGMVVFNINYRLAPQDPFPAGLADCAEAYRFVLENAAAYGGDPARIYVGGESAGANLTAALAIGTSFERKESFLEPLKGLPVPRAVLPACGLLDLDDHQRFIRAKIGRIYSDRIDEIYDAYVKRSVAAMGERDLISPLCVLERAIEEGEVPARPLPPFFVPCGTGDILIEDSRRLVRALEALGVEVSGPEYPREPHAFHALLWKASARQCMRDHYEFLAANGAFLDS